MPQPTLHRGFFMIGLQLSLRRGWHHPISTWRGEMGCHARHRRNCAIQAVRRWSTPPSLCSSSSLRLVSTTRDVGTSLAGEPLETISRLDNFALSRVRNYLTRVAATPAAVSPDAAPPTPANKNAQFSSVKTQEGEWKTSLLVPVDVMEANHLTRRFIEASGFGPTEKESQLACAMHAERCLDELGIPLFGSVERQRARAEQAQKEGRYAPMPEDCPRSLDFAPLPRPLVVRKSSISNSLPTMKPVPQRPKPASSVRSSRARAEERCGYVPFMEAFSKELAHLNDLILQESGHGKDADEEVEIHINPEEVSILQPEGELHTMNRNTSGTHASLPVRTSCCLAAHESSPLRVRPLSNLLDESEGGVYALVEGHVEEWHTELHVPSATCLRDPLASARLEMYCRRKTVPPCAKTETPWADGLTITRTEENSNELELGRPTRRSIRPWFSASSPIPGLPAEVRAVGKGTTIDAARQLCAMHAEQLLGYFGVPLFEDVSQQIVYYDGCLCWGRVVAAEPRDLSQWSPSASDITFPRPLKELKRPGRERRRGAPFTTTEKLLALTRRVVAEFRQHLTEVDLFSRHDKPLIAEVLELAVPCVRSFMVAQRHPYEGAYFQFRYAPNQYRCSMYLPLPSVYGIRGGCAIASTAARARSLCALHAVDVLCALDAIPEACQSQGKWKRMLELRHQLGLISPLTNPHTSRQHVRSPPGYREAVQDAPSQIPPHAEVWHVMLESAEVFDVCDPPPTLSSEIRSSFKHLQVPPDDNFSLAWMYLQSLLMSYLRFTMQWTEREYFEHLRHYCGVQQVNGHRSASANNYWMVLPIWTPGTTSATHPRRVAWGRCVTRKGAFRMFTVHVFRILRSWNALLWEPEVITTNELCSIMYGGDSVRMYKELEMWIYVKAYMGINTRNLSKCPASDFHDSSIDKTLRDVHGSLPSSELPPASPNPVMSSILANRTFR